MIIITNIRHGYNGGGTDGNNSKSVLDNLDKIAGILPIQCVPMIECLRALKQVVGG